MGIEKEDLRAREEQEIQQDVRAREEGPQDVEIGVLAEKHLKVATRTSLMTYTILAFDEVVALEEGKAVTCYGVHGHAAPHEEIALHMKRVTYWGFVTAFIGLWKLRICFCLIGRLLL